MKTRYEIPQENFSKFKAKLKVLTNKANKLGLTPPSFESKEFEKQFSEKGKVWFVPYVELFVESEEIKLSGWSFAATIDHREAGNIIRTSPKFKAELNLEKYFTAKSHCDHCSQQRKRNNTYLMANESNEIKQVGSSCIKDFIGHPSAEYYAELYAYLWEMEANEEEPKERYGRGREAFNPEDIVTVAVMMIRLEGYRSSKCFSGTTSGAVGFYMNTTTKEYKEAKGTDKPAIEEQDKKKAKEALELAKNFTEDELKNTFKKNLNILVNSEYVFAEDFGMLCYLPEMLMQTMAARMEKEAREKAAKASNYTGEVGQKMTFQVTLMKTVYLGEGFMGGPSYKMHLFKCGNDTLVWRTSKSLPESESGNYELTGTVKAHNEYKGAKQTEMTRCKISKLEKK